MNAKKEINLMPPKEKKYNRITEISKSFVLFSLMIFLLSAGAVAFIWIELQLTYTQKAKIELEIDSLQYVNDIHDLYNNKIKLLNDKQSIFNAMLKDKRDILNILYVIKSCLPENTYITNFSSNRGETFNFTVISPGTLDTIKLIVKFREPGLFEDIDINTISLLSDVAVNINLKLKK